MGTAIKATAGGSGNTRSAIDGFLKSVVNGKRLLKIKKGEKVFAQGKDGDAIYFIQTGRVTLTVVSTQGKEAVLARLGPRDFMGEECLVGTGRRTSTATAAIASTIFRIEKRTMLKALHLAAKFSYEFTSSLLARNIILEEDLSDQLFNHTERRLACALLKLTMHGRNEKRPDAKVSKITQEVLADMVGTTRLKIGTFMKKFRKLGLIEYKGSGDITVKGELLTEAVLHD